MAHDEATELRSKHELRAARARLEVCAAETCPTGLRSACKQEGTQVRLAIPTLILDAVDAAGNDVSHVKVTMDGQPLISVIDGTAVAVEPGPHKFSFEVPGMPPEVKTLTMTEGEKDKRVRIEIAPPPPPPSHEGTTQRILGLAFAGTALVTAGVATGFGLSARSEPLRVARRLLQRVEPGHVLELAAFAASDFKAPTPRRRSRPALSLGPASSSSRGRSSSRAPTSHSSTSALNVVSGVDPRRVRAPLRGTF